MTAPLHVTADRVARHAQPPILVRTDLEMTVPRAVRAEVAPRFGLVALPCPVVLPLVELALFWSAALDRNPAIVWFRGAEEAAAIAAFGGGGSRGAPSGS